MQSKKCSRRVNCGVEALSPNCSLPSPLESNPSGVRMACQERHDNRFPEEALAFAIKEER